MEGSRERLIYNERDRTYYTYNKLERRPEPHRSKYDQITPKKFDSTQKKYNSKTYDVNSYDRQVNYERPKRKNGFVYEDIYSDFDEAQGSLSLFRPINPEYLNLPTPYSYKYNSLPKNYRTENIYKENYVDITPGRYKASYKNTNIKSYEDAKDKSYEDTRNKSYEDARNKSYEDTRNKSYEDARVKSYEDPRNKSYEDRIKSYERFTYEPYRKTPKKAEVVLQTRKFDNKNVAVCKPMRLTEKPRYWTTESQKKKKTPNENKKAVTFSEVTACARKTVIIDPIVGKKVVPVRELEVSLDQMIQNGYFEKYDIPVLKEKMLERKTIDNKVENTDGLQTYQQNPIVRKQRHIPQVIAALAVSLAPFSAGLGKGYSSPAIASLQGTENATRRDFHITDQQASWLASLSFLGALFGGMVGGAAMRHGRRRILAFAAVPFSLSWLLTVLAASVRVMCLTSFLGGFCTSILTMLSQVYISEISVPDIRGCLSAVLKIVGHLGVLFSFTIGAYLDWQQLALCISAAPLLLFCTVLYIPETPSYLVLIGKDEEAYKSLLWLRGPESDVVQELATIKTNVLASKNFSQRQSQLSKTQILSSMDARTLNRLLGPILVTCGLMMFQRFSGAHAFSFYAVPIFRKTFGGMNPHGAAIAVSFVQLLASCLSGLLIDTVGRLPLLIVSSVLMSLALAGFGSYAYYEEVHRNQRIQNVMFHQSLGQNDWIPLLCVLVFTIAFSLGMSPISWLLIGELFPLEYRAFGSAMATAFSYLCAFVGVKTFVDFQQALGLHGAFWLYASISVGGLCFVVCCVPETKGRDLDEMDPNYVQNLSPKR